MDEKGLTHQQAPPKGNGELVHNQPKHLLLGTVSTQPGQFPASSLLRLETTNTSGKYESRAMSLGAYYVS